jgi:hypothetical protein
MDMGLDDKALDRHGQKAKEKQRLLTGAGFRDIHPGGCDHSSILIPQLFFVTRCFYYGCFRCWNAYAAISLLPIAAHLS